MKKTRKIRIVSAMLLMAIFLISACNKKESEMPSTMSTKEEVSTDESGMVTMGGNIFKIPKPEKVVLTVNGEEICTITEEKEIEKITDIMCDKEENIVTEGKVEVANWMYELYYDSESKVPKVYFTEDGKYECWHKPGGWDGNTYSNASTGIVEYLKVLVKREKRAENLAALKKISVIIACVLVFAAILAIGIYINRKKKTAEISANKEEKVFKDE